MSLGKNSKLDINEYVYDEKDSNNSKANFKFAEGPFKSITGAIGKVSPDKFKLETKSASIGIRGTIVVGNQDKVACTQGKIEVTSAGVTQVLGAGMMTNTEIGKAPTPPTKIEGNLLKEVELDSGTKKEESKSTTANKEKASEEKTSEKSDNKEQTTSSEQNTTTSEQSNSQVTQQNSDFQAPLLKDNSTQNTSIVNNVSTFTEVTNTVNTTISQTSANKIQEELADAKKKAEAIEAATNLSNEANTIAQNVAIASTNANSASTSATSIAEGSILSEDTQTAINIASTASTSASTLSSQAEILKAEIATLLAQAQNASSSEAVSIYEQIKIKTNLLNSKLTEATSAVTTAQNSLKTVSVNLASSLSSQANIAIDTITSQVTNTQTSTNTVSQLLENASTSALAEVNTFSNGITLAEETISSLSIEAQTLKDEITILLSQVQNASASEAVSIYGQIKIKSDSLNSLLTQVQTASSNASTIAQNISDAIVNIPVYSTSVNISSTGTGLVGSKTFTVGSGGSIVTIATYGSSDGSQSLNNGPVAVGFDPVLILLKLNSSGNYETISNGKNDDGWTVADNYYNSILNLSLSEGTYKILVSDYEFTLSEALAGLNGGTNDAATVKLYFTSTSNLTFDSSIEKYSYITRYNNKAYINDSSYTTAQIETNNAKFGILADSNVGTTIKIDDGYFVTISDSFDNSKNAFLNTSEVDDESSWGYWTKTIYTDSSETKNSINMKSAWISGNQVTPPTNYQASFQGQVIGGVTDENHTGYIKVDSDNQFKATIDIGSATITDSLIKFKDSLSNSWSGTFNTSGTANVNQQGFNSSITGTGTTGSLAGKYYGTNVNNAPTVQSIGGSFNMIKGESTANGVFKAREIQATVPSIESNIGQ